MTYALELTIGRLWTLEVVWCTGAVARYPATNEREAAALETVLAVHPKVVDVRRYPYHDDADLVPPGRSTAPARYRPGGRVG